MLAVKIIEIDHQHTPHLDFARPEQKGSIKIPEDQAKSRVHKQ